MQRRSISIWLGMFAMLASSNGEQARTDAAAITSGYKMITLKTQTGSECPAAYFHGEGAQAAIFVPGAVFNKESWFDLTMRLQQLSIASVALDGKTPQDVLAAIEFLKGRGFDRIAITGGSMGGAAVLNALEGGVDESVCKVVLLAPSGGNPVKSATINKLFIVSKEDRLGLYTEVKQLYQRSSDPKKFVEFDGSEHAQHLFKSAQKDELSRVIVDFISNEAQ